MSQNPDATTTYQLNFVKTKLEECERNLEAERFARETAEHYNAELSEENNALKEQIQDGESDNVSQITKLKTEEVASLKSRMKDLSSDFDENLRDTRTKFNLQIQQLQVELDVMRKAKTKADKEKSTIVDECNSLAVEIQNITRQKETIVETAKRYEGEANQSKQKVLTLESKVNELTSFKTMNERSVESLNRQVDDAYLKGEAQSKVARQLEEDLRNAKISYEGEVRSKQELNRDIQQVLRELDTASIQVEREAKEKSAFEEKLSKALDEAIQWKQRYAADMHAKTDEYEDSRKKLAIKLIEVEAAFRSADTKALNMEKVKDRMTTEIDNLQTQVDIAQGQVVDYKARLKSNEQHVSTLKNTAEKYQSEIETLKRDNQRYAIDAPKLRSANEQQEKHLEELKLDNKTLLGKLAATTEKLNDSSMKADQLEVKYHLIQGDIGELQITNEELDAAVSEEKQNLLRVSSELSTLRNESQRTLESQQDEAETIRKGLQREIDNLKDGFESESRAKAELSKEKKQIESLIMDLEGDLDESKVVISEQSKSIKKLQHQIRDIESSLEDEKKEHYHAIKISNNHEINAEKLRSELESAVYKLDQVTTDLRRVEKQRADTVDLLHDVQSQKLKFEDGKRDAEERAFEFEENVKEVQDNLKNANEKYIRVNNDNNRLSEELISAKNAVQATESERANFLKQIRELEQNVRDLEEISTKILRSEIRKLENRLRETEANRDVDIRKGIELKKSSQRAEKKLKDVQAQLEVEQISGSRAKEQADLLQSDNRRLKRDMEAMQSDVAVNRLRMSKLQSEVEEAEQRKEHAMQALMSRTKGRNV